MSQLHDGLWPSFHFGNAFRFTGHKCSSKLLTSESYFEQNLAKSMRKLQPKDILDVFSISWIIHAIKSISEAHTNIKTLIMELQLPVSDWDEEWIDMYLDSSVTVLDICIALSAEINRLDQGQLLLRYVLHILSISTSFPSSEQLRRAHVSLDDWLKQTNTKSPRLDKCHAILQTLQATLCLSKVKKSAKGKVLMRALYGVEVMTLFTCGVITAALTGCSKPLMDLHIADKFLWLETFNDLQAFLNEGVRRQLSCGKVRILKEIEAPKMSALTFHSLTNGIDYKEEPAHLSIDLNKDELNSPRKYADAEEKQRLERCIRVLTDGGEVLGHGLDSLSKQVNELFQILVTGRDALLCNLRASNITKRMRWSRGKPHLANLLVRLQKSKPPLAQETPLSTVETWLLISLSLSLCIALALLKPNKRTRRLPPGPPAVPILGNLLWLRHSLNSIEAVLRALRPRYGPIITLRIGSRTSIFISDPRLTHKALVEHGAAFADRPTPLPASRFLSNNQHNINTASYGPVWRLLRRNLVSETLHPSRMKLFADSRAWVLGVLTSKLRAQAAGGGGDASGVAVVMETFQFSMFCLLVLICFGAKLDEEAVRVIEVATRDLLLLSSKLTAFAFLPRMGKYLLRSKWNTVLELRRRQKHIYLPLIHARKEYKMEKKDNKERFVHSYVDSLLDVEIAEEGGRKLTEDELVGLCSEFMNAGTDTTSTALQWIMAELVRHQEVQEKLWQEVGAVAGSDAEEVKEEDLHRMPYLKAVVMEGLRRHPPAHLVLPHAVSEDVTIEGYDIPKGVTVNFLVAEIGWDEGVWEEPLEFKPERFLEGGSGHGVDVTGSREIKMMPFGVGRRICAGLGLAMLHLEYFVANLVKEFEWKAVEGEEVDLAEETEFTVVMKHPLRVRLLPRRNKY